MLFYVGSYSYPGSLGIAVCSLDNAQLRMLGNDHSLHNATWLTLSKDGGTLYALGKNEAGEQVVRSFWTQGERLVLLSEASTLGNSSCHLCLDQEERVLIASHYHEGRLSLYPLDQGRILPQTQVLQHEGSGPNRDRQQGPHAHQAVFRPGGQEVFSCDLGADAIYVYRFDGRLHLRERVKAPTGSGLRHLVFDGPDRFYACAELTSEVLRYEWRTERWQLIDRLTTLPRPTPGNTAAAIRLANNRLYVSNRGDDSIAVFGQAADGGLTPQGFISTQGKNPRDFVVVPQGFLVANQDGGGLQWLNEEGRALGALPMPGAVCVAKAGC